MGFINPDSVDKFFSVDKNVDLDDLSGSIADTEPFPEEIYDNVPDLLNLLSEEYDPGYRKDIVTLAAIAAISLHMENIKIFHRDGEIYPSFNVLVIAPPASGKGTAAPMRGIAEELDKYVFDNYGEKSVLILPSNSSYRAMFDSMEANGGKGLIFETEIDTMLNASQQAWGNFSTLIRKSFSHEPDDLSRRNDLKRIRDPWLSIFMTGTVDQFINMFPKASDGYISRYALYTFQQDSGYRSHKPNQASKKRNRRIRILSKQLLEAYLELETLDDPIYATITDDHWDSIDGMGEKFCQQFEQERLSMYLKQFYRRLPKVVVRLAVICSFIRKFGNDGIEDIVTNKELNVTDKDVELAIQMGNTFWDHTQCLIQLLPEQSPGFVGGNKQINDFYHALPTGFKRSEAIDVADSVGIPEASVDGHLQKLGDMGFLEKVRHGHYRKTQ